MINDFVILFTDVGSYSLSMKEDFYMRNYFEYEQGYSEPLVKKAD